MKFISVSFLLLALFQNLVYAQKTVWRANDLYRVEIETWFDILNLSPNWVNATNDDASIQFSRNGLAGLGGAWWPVYVNGIRIEPQAWDTKSLHLLPFSVSQLDSVVIIEEPLLYEGVYTEKGGVFLYTKSPEFGFQVEGNFSFGNKSGDPGPYVYTEHITPNVERVGPIADGLISYKDDQFSIKAGGSLYYKALTDNLLYYLRAIPFEHGTETPYSNVKIIGNSGFVEVDYSKGDFTHSVLAGGTKTEDYLHTSIYSIEVPVNRTFGFASFKGRGLIKKNVSINYQIGQNIQRTASLPNKGDLWLNWNQDITSVKSLLTHDFKKGYQTVGLGSEFLFLENELGNDNLSSKSVSTSYSIKYDLSDRLEAKYDGKLVHMNKTATKHHAELKLYSSDNSYAIFISGNHSHRLPGEDNSLWYWVSEKGFAGDTITVTQNVRLPEKSKYMSGKIGGELKYNRINLSIAGIISRYDNEYLPYVEVVLNRNATTVKEFNFLSAFDATYLRIPLEFKFSFKDKLFQEAGYSFNEQISGRRDVFSMLPKHRFSYLINWKPVQSLKLWTRVQVQSSSSWSYLSSLDEVEVTGRRLNGSFSDTYNTDSSARYLLDIGMKKYFWYQKLAFSIDLKNILDQHYRYTPLSSENRFTLFLKAHLNLP